MRCISESEISIIYGGVAKKETGSSSTKHPTCPDGYHWESGTASRSIGGGVGGGAAANGKGTESRSWASCTRNGAHHTGNGDVVPDKHPG